MRSLEGGRDLNAAVNRSVRKVEIGHGKTRVRGKSLALKTRGPATDMFANEPPASTTITRIPVAADAARRPAGFPHFGRHDTTPSYVSDTTFPRKLRDRVTGALQPPLFAPYRQRAALYLAALRDGRSARAPYRKAWRANDIHGNRSVSGILTNPPARPMQPSRKRGACRYEPDRPDPCSAHPCNKDGAGPHDG